MHYLQNDWSPQSKTQWKKLNVKSSSSTNCKVSRKLKQTSNSREFIVLMASYSARGCDLGFELRDA